MSYIRKCFINTWTPFLPSTQNILNKRRRTTRPIFTTIMPGKTSTHFVLVHGVMHGAWCWYKTADLLQRDGHTVTAIDLKSAGTDCATADSIQSFEEYNQPLMDFLATLPATEKIVLVGHSFGGISLAYASEAFPEKITVAVYVCAMMIRGGHHLQKELEYIKLDEEISKQYIYNYENGPQQPPTSITIPSTLHKYLFYGSSPSSDETLASLCLRPFPANAFANIGLKTSDEKYGRVPRVYIKTEKDNIVLPKAQAAYIAGSPPEEVHSLDCDHSPFFSLPHPFSRLLSDIATKFIHNIHSI